MHTCLLAFRLSIYNGAALRDAANISTFEATILAHRPLL